MNNAWQPFQVQKPKHDTLLKVGEKYAIQGDLFMSIMNDGAVNDHDNFYRGSSPHRHHMRGS